MIRTELQLCAKMRGILLTVLLALPLSSLGAMRDDRDRVISAEMIDLFRRECSHKSGIDQGKIQELQTMFAKIRVDQTREGQGALTCYQERMSQLIGIHQLYKDLCAEVAPDELAKKSDDDRLRILVMTQRYRRGITPFHDLLNDCLLEKSDSKYLVRPGRLRTESETLRQELDKLRFRPPFESNRVLLR